MIAGSHFTCLLNCCLASRKERQLVVWCFQQCARQHSGDLQRRIYGQIKSSARNGLFTLFAAIFPARPAILNLEMLIDWCLHVIVAAAVVSNGHSRAVEFPCCSDVIAASAIVV